MTKLYAVAAFMLLFAGSANAGETGIINQAGPYEAQMRFYLHPAHGFPGTREPAAQRPSTVDSERSAGAELKNAESAAPALTPVVRASRPARNRADHVAAAGRG